MRTTNPTPTTPADPAQAAAAGPRAVRAEHPRSARRALVVGMGVSGMAAATRLHRAGWSVTIVERSRQRRTGGYFVALFGTGQKAARRLGLLDALHDRAGDAASLDIDRSGRAHPAMTLADAPGKPWMMLRGDVERATFEALPDEVEVRFATSPVGISQDADGADVTLEERSGSRTTERFDLVIGADGIHSTVRRLVFGPEEQFHQAARIHGRRVHLPRRRAPGTRAGPDGDGPRARARGHGVRLQGPRSLGALQLPHRSVPRASATGTRRIGCAAPSDRSPSATCSRTSSISMRRPTTASSTPPSRSRWTPGTAAAWCCWETPPGASPCSPAWG
jgi:2-polyprenyl-6-methoxyphenol hydroxylase-like FAD-dependent oxidoreductase